jgi:hypothetical protein
MVDDPCTFPGVAPAMRRRRGFRAARSLVVAGWLAALWASPLDAQVQGTYLYTLSNFAGRLPYDWARLQVDQERDETYVIYQNLVRIFNSSGMEVFSFGDDLDLGRIVDAAVDADGDIILLSYTDSHPVLTRCNFRGVPLEPFEISNLPSDLDFRPNRIVYRNGQFYFVTTSTASVIVTDASGAFREHIDLLPLMDLTEKQKSEAEVAGFSVDGEGNLFFTIPVFFKAYKFSADRKLTPFGRAGSAPGRFGLVAGIVSDSRGRVIVVDKLKCAIMVFDKDLNFLTEFGTRGSRPENLIVPDDVTIDKRDRLYVTQGRRRGVSVFVLTGD